MRAIVLSILFAAAVHAADLADLTVRYVNDEVVTMGDVQLRNEMRRAEYSRSGKVLPRTAAEFIAFSRKSLDDITDDVLLAQKAKELGIAANHDEIVLKVLEDSRRRGIGLSLREQAEQRRMRERKETIDRITGWYASMQPMPRPQDLLDAYNADTKRWDRPTVAHLYEILIRPSPAEDRQQLRNAKSALLRKAQDATDPKLKALVDARLADYLAADTTGQDGVLNQLVTGLADHAGRTDLPAADQAIVAEAVAAKTRMAALITPEDVRVRLETARLSLIGLRGEALISGFREQAKRISQGPAAVLGGDISWVEEGSYTKDFDMVAFNLARGELSRPFRVGDTGCLVLCADRKEAQVRSFDEVSGEIENTMRWAQLDQTRQQAVAILRGKASIRDVNPLDKLPQ